MNVLSRFGPDVWEMSGWISPADGHLSTVLLKCEINTQSHISHNKTLGSCVFSLRFVQFRCDAKSYFIYAFASRAFSSLSFRDRDNTKVSLTSSSRAWQLIELCRNDVRIHRFGFVCFVNSSILHGAVSICCTCGLHIV